MAPQNDTKMGNRGRHTPQDITAPTLKSLVDLAFLRVRDAASPSGMRPPTMYPATQTLLEKGYTEEDWLVHGDLETARGRMSYTLSNLPERGIPASCIDSIHWVLSAPSICTAWEAILPRLQSQVTKETQSIIHQMQNERRWSATGRHKAGYITLPATSRVDLRSSTYALQLLEDTLSEVVTKIREGCFTLHRAFLQIFAFLKDPLAGIETVSDNVVDHFSHLMTAWVKEQRQRRGRPLAHENWQAAAAQAAQEALVLADPLLRQIHYIHFAGNQQLSYVYVPLEVLPRSEFSIPSHVCRIVEEILTAAPNPEGHCPIAPIAVASYPSLPLGTGKLMTVIIDGNHRATAAMVLRLIAEQPSVLAPDRFGRALRTFCTHHGLDVKWNVDLADALAALRNSSHHVELLRTKADLVQRFCHVTTIPALVVREDDFHTACQQRPAVGNRPRLLLPIHQALYNDARLGFAFPRAGQVHGRAMGFKAMPLLRHND